MYRARALPGWVLSPDIDMTMKERFRLVQKMSEKDFHVFFYDLTEDYDLVDAWDEFEEKELTAAAVAWCEEHGVEYTFDEPPPHELSEEMRAFNNWLEKSSKKCTPAYEI